jgi:membrane associated rhomboid family serine protease
LSNYYRPSGFGGFSYFPPVIKNLLIINGAVFFLQLLLQNLTFGGIPADNFIIRWFALMPLGSGYFEVWQLITYQFMHGGFFHIAINMFILWMFGIEIENLWGSKKFLIFYLTAGVVGGLFQILLSPVLIGGLSGPTIGASGAIMGVMVVFGILFPNRLIYLYFLIPIKVKYFIIVLVLIEIFAVNSGGNIAHLAHVGGALTGFVYMMWDRSANFKNIFRSTSQFGGGGNIANPFKNISNPFKKKERNVEDANFYEIKDKEEQEHISQADIDKILDKISQSGYQNLTEKEKKILFEASKKMK